MWIVPALSCSVNDAYATRQTSIMPVYLRPDQSTTRIQCAKEEIAKIERRADRDAQTSSSKKAVHDNNVQPLTQGPHMRVVTAERGASASAGQAQAWTGRQRGTETRALWTLHKATPQMCSCNAALVPRGGQRRHQQTFFGSSTLLADWSISTDETWLRGEGGGRGREIVHQVPGQEADHQQLQHAKDLGCGGSRGFEPATHGDSKHRQGRTWTLTWKELADSSRKTPVGARS